MTDAAAVLTEDELNERATNELERMSEKIWGVPYLASKAHYWSRVIVGGRETWFSHCGMSRELVRPDVGHVRCRSCQRSARAWEKVREATEEKP